MQKQTITALACNWFWLTCWTWCGIWSLICRKPCRHDWAMSCADLPHSEASWNLVQAAVFWFDTCAAIPKTDLSWRNVMSSGNMVKQLLLKFHSYLFCNLSVSVSRVHAYMALLQVVTSCMREQHVICQKQHTIVSCVKCASGFQGTRLVMKITTNSLLCFLSIDFVLTMFPVLVYHFYSWIMHLFKQDELDRMESWITILLAAACRMPCRKGIGVWDRGRSHRSWKTTDAAPWAILMQRQIGMSLDGSPGHFTWT